MTQTPHGPDPTAVLMDAWAAVYRAANAAIARLAVRRLAEAARRAVPDVAYVAMSWSDQGPYLTVDDLLDGTLGPLFAPGRGHEHEDLIHDMSDEASGLDEYNSGTWQGLVHGEAPDMPAASDGCYLLPVEACLRIDLPAPPS